jgi:hypothetical protein
MLVHQLADDLILLDELSLEPLDELGLKSLDAGRSPGRALQSTLGLVKHLDPGVDLTGTPNSSAGLETGALPLTWRRSI